MQGGSQRLSSALARAIRNAGGTVLLRRTAGAIELDASGRVAALTHTAKDGGDPQRMETACIVGNAAPAALAALLPDAQAMRLRAAYAGPAAVDLAVPR